MSLYDHVAPSERVGELDLIVKRIRRHTGLEVVPVLVVEGPADESLLRTHCRHDPGQVFAAGTRGLVEGMLIYIGLHPVSHCECIYLTDCDGVGKAPSLRMDRTLLVTQGCDLEADLVMLGVVERTVGTFTSAPLARSLVQQGVAISLPLSVIRRRAHTVGVSMRWNGRRLRLCDLRPYGNGYWSSSPPSEDEVLRELKSVLGWSNEVCERVGSAVLSRPVAFENHGSGKDVLDAVWLLLRDLGVTAESSNVFHDKVRRALSINDISEWEVGRRILAWQRDRALCII